MRTTAVPSSLAVALTLALPIGGPARAAGSFVNFESGHTRPLSLSPDGTLLFAVNTPNNSLSIFEVDGSGIQLAAQVPVGLEPVAVASRVNVSSGKTEAWVANLLSDSVSVVEVDVGNLPGSHVIHTLLVGDEPRDVVFGGSPVVKAFVTTARRGQNLPAGIEPRFGEEGVPRALVWAFAAQDVGAGIGGTPLTVLELFGDTPRGLAVSPDGSTVYAAVLHSGNRTTVIREAIVIANGGAPPPPADSPYFGDPEVTMRSLIVRQDTGTGEWNDELGRNWNAHVNFSLPDRDVFAINANANPPVPAIGIDSFSGVGTTLFNLAVRPGTGSVFVANSEARNEVRFEPIEAGGVQGHAVDERITVLSGMSVMPVLVNPHIDYGVATGPGSEAAESLALLGDLVFSSDGASLFAAAMGSNQVAVFDAAALEAGVVSRDLIDVGRGPSGVALDEANDRLYVMNRLDHSISVVDDVTDAGMRHEAAVVSVGDDVTPAAILEGRPFLYAARDFSGHGDLACASCHTFGDADQLAWELGNPYGALEENPNPILPFPPVGAPPLGPFSPIKGPLTTQSLRGLADAGPMHWRGDRTAGSDPGGDPMDEDGAFKKFNSAFVELLGRPEPLSTEEMQAFTDFVLTMRYPPNPVRALDNRLTKEQEDGLVLFTGPAADVFTVPCAGCHALPLGTNGGSSTGVTNALKVPHLRATYQKVGKFGGELFSGDPGFKGEQVRGFGLTHDGGIAGPVEFASGFVLEGAGPSRVTGRLLAEFLLAFDSGLAPSVGQQVTIGAAPTQAQTKRLDLLVNRDAAGDCELTFAGRVGGVQAVGVVYPGGRVELDDSTLGVLDRKTLPALSSAAGGEQTYTCRPPGTGKIMTTDRDGDGVRNADEVREGTDPFDTSSVPFDCTGGSAIAAAKMMITKIAAPSGDERITIKAEWIQPPFTVDPAAEGLALLLRDDAGAIAVHQGLPASGWTANSGTRWSYAGPAGAVVAKARLSLKNGMFKLNVNGRGGDFRMNTATPQLVLVFGGNVGAAAGQCMTRTFGVGEVPACALSTKKMKCG
jgi:DNA-binding beta-propeller fold protein YncE